MMLTDKQFYKAALNLGIEELAKAKEAYFAAVDALSFEGEGVLYNEDGSVTLKF